jgi:hypothetical protein
MVMLLISNTYVRQPTDATPINIVTDDLPESLVADTQVPIYAKVTWKKFGEFSEEEGGRAVNRTAIVEASSQYQSLMQKCFGVKLENGLTMVKQSEGLTDSKGIFMITVTAYATDTEL